MEGLKNGNMTKEELDKLKYEIIKVNEFSFEEL